MEIFWCDNCNTPVIKQKYISDLGNLNEKAEENPYIDIEDEITDWILKNNKYYLYDVFLNIKDEIQNMLLNNKNKKHIKNFIENNYSIDNDFLEFIYRYLDFKLNDQNDGHVNDYQCPKCNKEVEYIGRDIRPVFIEERIMLSVLLDDDFINKNLWKGTGNRYIEDGDSLNISKKELYNINDIYEKAEEIRKRIENNEREIDFSNFIDVNKKHFKYLDKNAQDFIEDVSTIFADRMEVVSFSGGKDSTVVSDLVTRALTTNNILHVFGDTTLEFPFTYEYVERLKNKNVRPPFLSVDTSDQSFKELANKFGPPSRVMRWCCSIFKTGPIGSLFRDITEDNNILTYYGVRRSESNSRKDYDKISKSPKISKQLVVSPIIDWNDVDVWLYLLKRNIDFNKAYRVGFNRVGCWCCPNNSKWSEFLSKIYMPEKAKNWKEFLVNFAKKIGKPDPIEYIESGNWKARQGGQGLDTSEVLLDSEPCGLGEHSKHYDLKKPIDDSLYEFFKPFGIINKEVGNKLLGEVYILNPKTDDIMFKLQGRKGTKELKVIISNHMKNIPRLFQQIECQLRKFQSCIGCSACENVCPYDAINVRDEEMIKETDGLYKYEINENKCTHCKKCIAYFHKGCLVTKSMIDY